MKLAEYVLHASEQVLGQHKEHRLDLSDQMCSWGRKLNLKEIDWTFVA